VIADEPTTALDVTIQAQILDLRTSSGVAEMAMLLITHDLAIVAQMAHRVALMYAGQVVEVAEAEGILRSPAASVRGQPVRGAPGYQQARPQARVDPHRRRSTRCSRVAARRSLRQRDGSMPHGAATAH
jgi:peptide/nickel transport system ATP-binding protein